MNLTIESLNLWGARALDFAWPVLWQSSLLIGLLFTLDVALRRRVRAAVRYALWLTVLVKLVLPPALALPTGLGWWLRPTEAAPAAAFTISHGPAAAPSARETVEPETVEPMRPALSSAAWGMVVSGGVSLGLLAWMLTRWRRVARDVRQAEAASEPLRDLLEEARDLVGLRQPVRLGLTERPMSPAVCGLFRPHILLPRSLAEKLSPSQLRAVLVHELIHVRRRDVWVNCAQALLQLLYWWHPLLWLANARIRQAREMAVDDAVMAALREDAEAYAPTLVEVARLALQRPLASLSLVGILESRGALRQRIERLLDFCPPRKAGLTFGSLWFVLAFGAVALPMGQGPVAKEQVAEPTAIASGTNASVGIPRGPELVPEPSTNVVLSVATNREAAARYILTMKADPKALAAPQELEATNSSTVRTQICIQSKFIAFPEEFRANFWLEAGVRTSKQPITAILTPAQIQTLLSAVQHTPNTDLLSESSVTTLSGRQCEVQVVDFVNVVTNFTTNASGVQYASGQIPIGPTVDFVPAISKSGREVELKVIATLNEFLGYDEPTNKVPVTVNGKTVFATPPLPRFHISSVTNLVTVPDGHTLVLGGLVSENILKLKEKVPVLGDIPLLGRLFRSEHSTTDKKHVVVLVTPTLIDEVGNRLHDGD